MPSPPGVIGKQWLDRMKALALHWVEHGFGSPRMIHTIYVVKLLVFYVLGGITVATWTSHLPPFWDVAGWWNQPIVYEKAVLWTVLLETIGVAGSWGPLAGKFKPMTGGIRFWARPGTIRLRPWRRVPFTAGDRRTWLDVALYLALLVSVTIPLVLPGAPRPSLSAALPHNTSGLVNPALLVPVIVLLVLVGLRDKTVFLAARGEQYLPALLHNHLTRTAARRLFPALRKNSLVGAICYYDGQIDDARHTMMLARTARLYGASCASSARVTGFLREGDRVVGATVRDLESGVEIEVRAPAYLCSCPPATESS